MSGKTLSIIKIDLQNFINYLQDRMNSQLQDGKIDDANVTMETKRFCSNHYQELDKFVEVKVNKAVHKQIIGKDPDGYVVKKN